MQDDLFHLLTQGIQRRFIITLSYESGTDVQWTKVTELVVGMCSSIYHTKLLRLGLKRIVFEYSFVASTEYLNTLFGICKVVVMYLICHIITIEK